MTAEYTFTSAWVIFPELTQWDNRRNKLHWEVGHDLEAAANESVRLSYSRHHTDEWHRGMTFGDFVLVSNSESTHSEWFKMVHCQCCEGYKWETASWGDVFSKQQQQQTERDRYEIHNT